MITIRQLSIANAASPTIRPYRLSIDRCHFKARQLVGVVGLNGSGKSTLLKSISGLLDQESQAAIQINDQTLASFTRRQLAQQIAYVPQERQLSVAITVREVVEMGRFAHQRRFFFDSGEGSRSEAEASLVTEALRKAELLHCQHQLVEQLSGGERQRVFLARAFAQNCPMLVLDEPTANLDLYHQLALMRLLRAEVDAGKLVICALHDLSLASTYCDRLLVLLAGEIVADGAPEVVLNEVSLRKHFHLNAAIHPASQGGVLIEPLETALCEP